MATMPTRGASEDFAKSWQSLPGLAIFLRVIAFLIPLVVSLLVLRYVNRYFYRPEGKLGLTIWIAQAAPLGALVSSVADRLTRRLLPLAMLLDLSLVFPDQAPSRFGVALRTGTVKQLSKRVEEGKTRLA